MKKARKVSRKRKVSRTRRARSGGGLNKISAAVNYLDDSFGVVKILGTVKNGKLEIKTDVDEDLPNANITFIALNAPFKTRALTGAL